MSGFEDLEIRGAWCQMCGPCKTTCYQRCYLKDGKWLYTEGCPNAMNNGMRGGRTLCAKGVAASKSINHKGRLKYPLRRIGAKGPGAKFERITWDEAIEEIAAKLKEQKEKYGPETLGILSPQEFAVLATFGRRFLSVHGSPNYLHSAICFVQRQASVNATVGGPMLFANNSTITSHIEDTELLVCWGANSENSSINHGFIRREMGARKNGMKIIDVRPLCDPATSKADLWLPVRPGTDLALALGILHVIFEEDLYDHEFCDAWINGFEELKAHVLTFSVEWAAEHSGISAEKIKQAARMIAAAKPCSILYGNGVGDQSRDGFWTMAAIELIGAVCGNLGKRGGGADGPGMMFPPAVKARPRCDVLYDRMQASEEDIKNGWMPGSSKLVCPEFPRWYKVAGNLPTSSYLGGMLSVLSEKPYPLRTIIAQCTNPLSATRAPELVVKCLEKVDFYVAMDMFFNPSCEWADIVLPAASQYECSHQFGVQSSPAGSFIAINHKIADPPGEALSDWEFYTKLAVAMGYGDDFWNGDVDACLREQLEGSGITLEQLREAQEGIFIPREGAPAGAKPNNAAENKPAVAADPAKAPQGPDYGRMFSMLPNNKIQGKNELLGGKAGAGSFEGEKLDFLPVYLGPVEGIAETPELAKEYPYAFSDVHAHRLAEHSYFNNIADLRRFDPDPWLRINPQTASANDIADGDWVRVESPHGWCVLKATLTEGVPPEIVMARRGWWQSCDELGEPGYYFGNGGAETNVLYSGDPLHCDRFSSSYGKQTLVKLSKSPTPPLTWSSEGRGE